MMKLSDDKVTTLVKQSNLPYDSYLSWFSPVVLEHTVCSIGPKYIFHTVVGRLLNEFGYRLMIDAIWII
jgi:hypothetical protein